MEAIDDSGRPIVLPAPPRRIVSLVPSLTEIVAAVGAGAALVGVTRYCTDPPALVARLPKVGGTKNPDVAAICDLAPDLVLMNAEENRREDFTALTAHGLAVFVTEPRTVAAGVALLARIGALVGAGARGRALADAQTAVLGRVAAAGGGRRPVRYFCPIWKRPWMSFNAETYAHDVLRLAGGENVVGGLAARYPEVTLEAIAATAPEVVLLPDEPYPFAARDLTALAPLALGADRVHLVDGKALAWWGPRSAAGVAQFATLFAATT